jgi:hypothetical protein
MLRTVKALAEKERSREAPARCYDDAITVQLEGIADLPTGFELDHICAPDKSVEHGVPR